MIRFSETTLAISCTCINFVAQLVRLVPESSVRCEHPAGIGDQDSSNFSIEPPVKAIAIMRLNSIVPNFKAQTTQGPIDFYEWQGNS